MSAAPIIDVEGIGKAYARGRGEQRVWVLRDVALRVAPGAVLGLLGPNGAGKTTLIKILAGLLRPDAGSGQVLGYDLLRQHPEIRARVSLVAPTADVGTDNNLTVRQNLAFWAPIYGLHGAAAKARIDELLGKLGLTDRADFWPMHISAGQRQRLALARSLLAHNPLVFLDEPTNKLDLEGVRSVRKMIAELNRDEGATIVLTTHVMEEAEELCSEIALLRQGELIAHQPTADLTRSLQLARPIAVILRRRDITSTTAQAAAETPEDTWPAQLAGLPGVVQQPTVTGVTGSGEGSIDPVPSSARSLLTVSVQSLDLRATTPALLAWVRATNYDLVNMQAEPVTLTDVFTALARGQEPASSPQAS
jgi:ABC-2 type transport system ATP-binding protein